MRGLEIELIIKDRKLREEFYKKYLKEKLLRKNEFSSKELFKKALLNYQFAGYLKENLNSVPEALKQNTFETIVEKLYYSAYFLFESLLSLKGLEGKKHIATLCAVAHLFPEFEEDALKVLELTEFRESVTYGAKFFEMEIGKWFAFLEHLIEKVGKKV